MKTLNSIPHTTDSPSVNINVGTFFFLDNKNIKKKHIFTASYQTKSTQVVKMFRALLALSLFSITIAAPSQIVSTPALAELPVCGDNEILLATGGGCFVKPDGVQQCAPPKPPTCQCESGFQRNASTKKCDKSNTLAQLRAGRSVSVVSANDCNGPNEQLVAKSGGCYIGTDGVQQCAEAQPPTCQCTSGYQRNATTKKCEKSVTAVRAGRSISDAQKNCSGPNEHLVAVGGGCYVDVTGKQVCAPPPPPSCVCASGFERNPTSKLCETASSVKKTKL